MIEIIVAIIGGVVALIGYGVVNSSDKRLMQYKLDMIQSDISDINLKFKKVYSTEKEIELLKMRVELLEKEIVLYEKKT